MPTCIIGQVVVTLRQMIMKTKRNTDVLMIVNNGHGHMHLAQQDRQDDRPFRKCW
ncbi:hypothetical protein [Crateriforma conspicua]|uniref:hypothetical protein n=1 Tax=Crateriforma TaxID=2714592 RepID=UPI0018CEF850|nr:hypothetical protein [Crateriforma conspicua]